MSKFNINFKRAVSGIALAVMMFVTAIISPLMPVHQASATNNQNGNSQDISCDNDDQSSSNNHHHRKEYCGSTSNPVDPTNLGDGNNDGQSDDDGQGEGKNNGGDDEGGQIEDGDEQGDCNDPEEENCTPTDPGDNDDNNNHRHGHKGKGRGKGKGHSDKNKGVHGKSKGHRKSNGCNNYNDDKTKKYTNCDIVGKDDKCKDNETNDEEIQLTPTLPVNKLPGIDRTTTFHAVIDTQQEIDEEDIEGETLSTFDVKLEDGEGKVLGRSDENKWALLNLFLTGLTALISIILLVAYLGKDKDDEDRRGLLRALSLIPAAGAIILFLLTEDWTLPMQFIDWWTIPMIVIALIQVILAVNIMRRDYN